jgi:hypothetical protein
MLVEATPTEGYAVHVRFEDSTCADVDLSYLLDYGGIFEPLRDPEYFRQPKVDPDAMQAPFGAFTKRCWLVQQRPQGFGRALAILGPDRQQGNREQWHRNREGLQGSVQGGDEALAA